jgi:hypothetical protein
VGYTRAGSSGIPPLAKTRDYMGEFLIISLLSQKNAAVVLVWCNGNIRGLRQRVKEATPGNILNLRNLN